MPPVLGWAAVTGEVGRGGCCSDHLRLDAAALWSLALYRTEDYAKAACRCCRHAGKPYTRLQVLLYTDPVRRPA
jgi:heme O synthase-like polyprenyltransferase